MKKGQVKIFVIIGIILVVAVTGIFIFRAIRKPTRPGLLPEETPISYLKLCTEDRVGDVINKISSQGGYLERKALSKKFMFNDENSPENISYLCYVQKFYDSCVNQEPLLIHHLIQEIEKGLKEDMESCFYEYVDSIENEGFKVQEEYNGFNVSLIPSKIVINIDGKISMAKAEKTIVQDEIKIVYLSKFYDLAVIVKEIVNSEAKYCNFDQAEFMIKNPDILIDKFRTGDSTLIYRITHKKTNEIFKFAIRGCVYPPGV